MALTDQVIMPGSDYQAICDATRTLTGKTATLKSGDISTELGTVTPQGETWILGLVPSSSSGATGTFSAIFTSSYYSNMIFYGIKCSAITNGYKIEFYTNSEKTSTISPYSNGWGNDNIRKLTFKSPPTDAKFLSWLNVWQGEKQNTDLAVCLEDSITIRNTPYVYEPEHPYDGTKKLNITISPTTQATPSISVNAAGLITASATQSAGYVTAGTKSATQQLTTQSAKTVTPSNSSQTAVSSGVYTTGAVTVAAVPTETKTVTPVWAENASSNYVLPSNGKFLTKVTLEKPSTLTPPNIRKGVSIGGVAGAYEKQVWIFPDTISVAELLINGKTTDYDISFTSAGNLYTKLRATISNKLFYYDPIDDYYETVYDQSKIAKWTQQKNRKIVLQETPSSSFLTHLQKVATKQTEEDVAVQSAFNQEQISSNGTYTYSPTDPYDALEGVTVTVSVSSSGVDLPFTKLATVSTDNGILSFSFTGYYNTIIAKRSGTNKVLTAVFGNNLKASFSIESEGDVLSTSGGFSYYQVGNKYNVTWNISNSSGSVWYEGSYDIYGCRNG